MIHNISYRVFVYGTENENKVKESLTALFPNISPEKEETEGYYKNPVIILKEKINKKREIKEFIHKLQKMDENQKETLLDNLERKMDDRGNLFLRFNKQEAYQGNWKIVEHGDAVHVRIKIAAYPAKKKVALKIVRDILGGL